MQEFEQMEIEYFIDPAKINDCPYINSVMNHEIPVIQQRSRKNLEAEKMTMRDALAKGIIKTQWHAYWLANAYNWFISLGATAEKFRISST
jgi:glycyl-tRNA synthetase